MNIYKDETTTSFLKREELRLNFHRLLNKIPPLAKKPRRDLIKNLSMGYTFKPKLSDLPP
jgi:hypothetical protein